MDRNPCFVFSEGRCGENFIAGGGGQAGLFPRGTVLKWLWVSD